MLIVGSSASRICNLKKELSKHFAMKDLGPAKGILGMNISRNRKENKLWFSQEKDIEKVLQQFNMDKAKAVTTPLAASLKLSVKQCPSNEKEKEDMQFHMPQLLVV